MYSSDSLECWSRVIKIINQKYINVIRPRFLFLVTMTVGIPILDEDYGYLGWLVF